MIAIIFAAYRARRRWRTNTAPAARYVRKIRPRTLRAPQSPTARHRVSRTRPSYSSPAYRLVRPVRNLTHPSPAVPLVRKLRAAVREGVPVRSTIRRTTDQAAIVHRWALQRIDQRAEGMRTFRRHCANARRDRRNSIRLPYIGLCWDTAEYPTVSAF